MVDERVANIAAEPGEADDTPSDLVLGPMLRYVSDTQATIWVETSSPAVVSILGFSSSTFTVRGKHYALVIVDDLEPGSVTPYQVRVNERLVWPPSGDGSALQRLPPSVIRTTGEGGDALVLVGSCRAVAPHEPPYTLEIATDERGRGVDALWAHAKRMTTQEPARWPTLLILVGDQIYADDSSPNAKERIEQLRGEDSDLPPEIVADFDEYCWLYHEAWSPPLERWLFSVVPTVMIFDDHDVIDDWNISASWVADMHRKPWWKSHSVGSVMSYWIYQHLGNLSPAELHDDGLLSELEAVGDGSELLEAWAESIHEATPGRYRFSYCRDLDGVRVIVIDCRHSRVLDGDRRLMVDPAEWRWIRDRAMEYDGHLILATSVPVFIAPGLHDLQVWNERVCAGAWGTRLEHWGERIRRSLDLEDWSAFSESYADFVRLIQDLFSGDVEPKSVAVASGDIHFSYLARVRLGPASGRVYQVVSSPIRNALIPPERGVMRFTLTRTGRWIGAALRRSTRQGPSAVPLGMAAGPFFANNMGLIRYAAESVQVVIEQAVPDGEGGGQLNEVADITL